MDREELDWEFLGNEWECGYSYGTQGLGLTEAAVLTAKALERALTATETLRFSEGWQAGVADRAAWLKEMESPVSPWNPPIAVPY